jgi:hypothetical protein
MIVFVNCIGFGVSSTDARWKIPATYTIVEVLDLVFVETTSKLGLCILLDWIEKARDDTQDNLLAFA